MFRLYPDRSWDLSIAEQPQENIRILTDLIHKHDVRSVCEIGTYMGASALFFAGFEQIEVVVCVDPWEAQPGCRDEFGTEIDWPALCGVPRNYFAIFVDNMRRYGVWEKIVPVARTSLAAWNHVPQVDLVYVDGDHSYGGCYWDCSQYNSKARKVISGDDVHYRKAVIPEGYYPGMPALSCPNSDHSECGCTPCYPGVVRAVREVFPKAHIGSRFWWNVQNA